MLIVIISRSSLKLDHVGSKTRLLGHQATQVSDLGPLWPSCLVSYFCCSSFQFFSKNLANFQQDINLAIFFQEKINQTLGSKKVAFD